MWERWLRPKRGKRRNARRQRKLERELPRHAARPEPHVAAGDSGDHGDTAAVHDLAETVLDLDAPAVSSGLPFQNAWLSRPTQSST